MTNNLNFIWTKQIFDTLREQLKQQGYVLVKSFFNRKELANIREIIIGILLKKGWGSRDNENVTPASIVHRIGSVEYIECLKSIMSSEEFHLISLEGRLPFLMSQLLYDEVFSHPRKMIRISYPTHMNPTDMKMPHQDIFYVKGEIDTLTAWIPLGDYPIDFGGLKIAHGSHKMGFFPINPNSEGPSSCATSNLENKKIDWRVSHYEMGDLLIFHSLTLHSAGENLSDYFRLSLDCRFSSVNGSINEVQLLPPYYPKLPDWNELASKWSSYPFTPPSSLQIESNDTPLEIILKKKSIFV